MKYVKKIILILTILISIGMLSCYIYLMNVWKVDFTENEVKAFVSEIKDSENLPNKFHQFYNVDSGNSLDRSVWEFLFNSFVKIQTHQPISIWIARLKYIPKMEKRTFPKIMNIKLSLAQKIEKNTTSKERLNYVLNNIGFLNGQIGVRNASKYYFEKEISELNDFEIASLNCNDE
ncbi:transglycosylase domain-containing protein [Flavobacterium sp. NRK F10]|uniref:transglycosylase domain-containing protein n=1 Tax=Flavobacterium sp. NRK F10 TaxID=2954931 RepID=UPI00208FFDC7|nr:transglycosylase domain-containing protein [Flavobacterium sp. NRK F10]MCO6176197.1 transglycosylase domain-containing protein [Flavobacterium sp. NRK F10]